MEENRDNELDLFVKKIVDEIGLEEPPIDFTDSILSKIQSANQGSTVYKPVISKFVWLVLTFAVIGIFAYVLFGNPGMRINWPALTELNKPTVFNLSFVIPDLSISNTFVYGFLALAFFMGVQVFVLKQYFAKRIGIYG